jgi:nitrite reductase/ring-hydroxylating ferredoxin subunit
VVRGQQGTWHAYENRCAHAGRRLDPIPGAGRVQCCSLGKSTYDASGDILSGSAKKGINAFAVTVEDGLLKIPV